MKPMLTALLVGCLISLLPQRIDAQSRPFTEFKVGYRNPEGTEGGNLFGISSGRRIDDRLYWGGEINYFRSSYRQETTIAEFNEGIAQFEEVQLELDFNTRILDILGKIDYELKLGRQSPFYFRASAGLGIALIWNAENNFREDIERTRFFNGFAWQLTSGLGLRISQAGLLFFDVMYIESSATRNGDKNADGLPIWQEIDLSGFGFKIGINIFGLGF